jgi:hypothetical protein
MREKFKLIINIVLVCVTIERVLVEYQKEHQRRKRSARTNALPPAM